MTEINDKIGFREFLSRIFISDSGVSSRRVLAVGSWIALMFLIFFQYPIGYCKLVVALIAALLALTTVSSYGQKPKDNIQNKG
jgi:hypothetical protein